MNHHGNGIPGLVGQRERERETWTKTFCSVISGFMVSKEGRGNRVIYGAERFFACHKQGSGIERFKTRHFPYLSPWLVPWLLGETNRRMKGEKLPPLRHLSLSNSFLSHLACGKNNHEKREKHKCSNNNSRKKHFFRQSLISLPRGDFFAVLFYLLLLCSTPPLMMDFPRASF